MTMRIGLSDNRPSAAGLLALLLALVLSAAMGGCSAPVDTAGNNLRVVVASDPGSLNPWRYSSVVDRHVLFNVYDHITSIDLKDFSVKPELAESWETTPDGLSMTLRIRPGVRFHSGREMTSADVAASIEQARMKEASRTAAFLSAVSAVSTPDPLTVRLTLARPDRILPVTLADVLVAPQGFTDFNNPDGTGPFMFGEWQHGRQLTLRRNPAYWRQGQPKLDQVTFQVVSDQSTALMQLQAGQADMVDTISFSQLGQARRAGLQVVYPQRGENTGIYTIFLNTEKAPFNDQRVRQALSLAIDREQIGSFLTGVFTPESNPIPRNSPAFDPTAPSYDRPDIDRARELLAEAGYRGGVDAGELVVYSNLGIDFIMAAQAVQQQAARAGLRLRIKQADISSWSTQVISKHDFTAALGAVVPLPTDYDRFAAVYAKANGRISMLQNRDQAFFDEVDRARAQPTEESYNQALKDLQQRAQNLQHVVVLGRRTIPVGTTNQVQGFIASPQQYLQLREVSVTRA
ncbi:hypothetical protein CGZ95_00110 [Enemella evansiae]|uniref:ABC transporter substrate-binding protein n=1 Tax=Enemella evansiae TaxID=2016499 RepID=UPI000B968AA8|nr:ABC transporter substrate-binding protein [Enemella evansiae]OYO06731.1 hypothetical protein CGZ95_00110 [Enemella evansiae]